MNNKLTPIDSVDGIYAEISGLALTASRLWGITHNVQTDFRVESKDLITIIVANDGLYGPPAKTFRISRFLVDMSPTLASLVKEAKSEDGFASVIHLPFMEHLEHCVTCLKLLWLLRLSAAFSELDYQVLSLKRLMIGVLSVLASDSRSGQEVIKESVPSSGLRMNRLFGSIFLPMMLDHLTDTLRTSFGFSFDNFLMFVASCDPYMAVKSSSRDLNKPKTVSSDALVALVEDIFLAHLAKQPGLDLHIALCDMRKMQLPIHALLVEPMRWFDFAGSAISKRKLKENETDLNSGEAAEENSPKLLLDCSPRAPESLLSPTSTISKINPGLTRMFPALLQYVARPNRPGWSSPGSFPIPGIPGALGITRVRIEAIRFVCLVELRAIDGTDHFVLEALKTIAGHHQTFPEGLRMRVVEKIPPVWNYDMNILMQLAEAAGRDADRPSLTSYDLDRIVARDQARLVDKGVEWLLRPPVAGRI